MYNIAVCRTINARFQPSDDVLIENLYQRDFWINTSNNAIQMAIIDWCKVFGWSEITHSTVDEQICAVMARLRNKFIAHKTETAVPMPMLDGVIEVMFDSDKKIREEYDLDKYQNLEVRFETHIIRIEDLMEQYGIKE